LAKARVTAVDVGAVAGAQSVRRALAVLRALAEGQEAGVGLSDVARTTGLSRPTVHRIVRALMEEGLVEQNARNHRYAIGEQVSILALARRSRSPLLLAAQPHLDRLAKEIGDTLFLTVMAGSDTVCVARRIGAFPIQVLSIEVGARRPLGVSSAGIALLAALAPDHAAAIVMRNKLRFRSYQVTPSAVLDQVRVARRRGYEVRPIGLVPGTKSLSVVVRDAAGAPVAALTISAIVDRLPPRRECQCAARLREAAREIERTLIRA
jgi:DNA-binding IclR family transcriptional regulator